MSYKLIYAVEWSCAIMAVEEMKLVILETSDIHGNMIPINYANNEKTKNGISKIASIIKEERNSNKNIILIDNGDMLQGTPLTYYYAKVDKRDKNPIIDVLNFLKYDAAVIGNHEFNYGMDILNSSIKQSNFPWISANILNEDSSKPIFGKPYIIKKFQNGLRVGVLGLTTKYIPNWENSDIIKGISFEDVVKTAEKWIGILKEKEKVDLVVVSYHGGFERDLDTGKPTESLTGENQAYELCIKVKGIDVLLTGHQHRFIENKYVNGVLVLQPGNAANAIGRVEVNLKMHNNVWKVIDKKSKLVYCEKRESQVEIENIVKDIEKDTQNWLDKCMGNINGDMTVKDYMNIRTKDNALIEFINKVQMDSASVDISNTALFDNKSTGFPSKVTMRDIVSNYVYPNTLKVIRIKGNDIKEALEKSASYFANYDGKSIKVNPRFTTPKPQHYNYDMWEGIDYEINISKPAGKRITKLDYKGSPLDMKKEYDVVMNNYRAGGGGNYSMFKGKPVIKDIPIDMSELIANYILSRGTINADVDGNWKVVHD
jgi:2',3'-cyclic-nucleotide 2'-phosphodiesterase/3'-nucleotidase